MKSNNISGVSLLALSALMAGTGCTGSSKPLPQHTIEELPAVAFSADSAYAYVAAQTSFGPRVPGSDAHAACLGYLTSKMRELGAEVSVQEGEGTGFDGRRVPIRNVICSYRPDRVNRILLCSHWDSRPFADQDPDPAKRDTPISGANDGASGVGVLMEIGRQLQAKAPHIGVDLIFFDTEDGGAPSHRNVPDAVDAWCVGSTFWAQSTLGQEAQHRYGILLDMVGAPDAIFPVEGYSKNRAPQVIEKVWTMAERRGHGNLFSRQDGGWITDDHVPVNRYTKVPMIDLIHLSTNPNESFCKTWHTQDDVIDNISRQTLGAVGETLLTVIYTEK